jgi:hypothetical protein
VASNISTTLSNWSATPGSNQPDATDLASTLGEDLQAIQAAVRYLRTAGTIASAGTTDLATKSEEILSVSGTTTITALGTVSAGMIKVLVFEGALTFTHNGTSLILPDAANIVTTAGDVAVMLSLGSGNWRCLSYTFADNCSMWTPVLTFETAGNVSVAYSSQVGTYQRAGKMITAQFVVVTSAFTHTTASSFLKLTGLPFAAVTITSISFTGSCYFGGITSSGTTQVTPFIQSGESQIYFAKSASGVAAGRIVASEVPTGGSVVLIGSVTYQAA